MSQRYWTTTEIAFLTEVYGVMKVDVISEKLERTRQSVLIKANRLGLTSKLPKQANLKYKEEEIKELIDFGYEPSQIATILKMSTKAVYNTVKNRTDINGNWYRRLINNRKHNRRAEKSL